MTTSTKRELAAALKKMMSVKAIDKITVRDLVEICGVNRQTFYYHFEDIYDLMEWIFEEDANTILPETVSEESWKLDVIRWMTHLKKNSVFVLNIHNSKSRLRMLRYIKDKAYSYVIKYCDLVSADMDIDDTDYEYVVSFCAEMVAAFASRWLDNGMELPEGKDAERFLKILDNSVEDLLSRFQKNKK